MANTVKLVSFFVLMVLLWPKASANITEHTKEMMDQFTSLTSPTHDIISGLRIFSEDSGKFLSVAGPVGAFLAAAAESEFKPKAEEFEAIKVWHDFVKVEFERLKVATQEQTSAIKYYLISDKYTEKIEEPLNGIESTYKRVMDPDEDRPKYKRKFIALCDDHATSPHQVLLKMRLRLKDKCPLPSRKETEAYAAVVELFQKIEQRHFQSDNKIIPMEEYETIKNSLLSISAGGHQQSELNKILQSANSAEAGKALAKLHSELRGAQNGCWLLTIAAANAWKRESVFSFAKAVRLDLLKAFLIASHCAEISDAAKSERDEIKMLLEIVLHSLKWPFQSFYYNL